MSANPSDTNDLHHGRTTTETFLFLAAAGALRRERREPALANWLLVSPLFSALARTDNPRVQDGVIASSPDPDRRELPGPPGGTIAGGAGALVRVVRSGRSNGPADVLASRSSLLSMRRTRWNFPGGFP